jgi:hypothetical protein
MTQALYAHMNNKTNKQTKKELAGLHPSLAHWYESINSFERISLRREHKRNRLLAWDCLGSCFLRMHFHHSQLPGIQELL